MFFLKLENNLVNRQSDRPVIKCTRLTIIITIAKSVANVEPRNRIWVNFQKGNISIQSINLLNYLI